MLQIVIDNLEALKLDYSRFGVQKNYFNSEMISITLKCSLPDKIGELTIWNDLSRVKEWIDGRDKLLSVFDECAGID